MLLIKLYYKATFKVETLPNYRIAYVRRIGPYGNANFEVMEKLKKWAKERNLLKSAILFAIPQDNPETTLPENCRFDACIVISKDYQMDDSIYEGELSGGKYLLYEVKHTAANIQKIVTTYQNRQDVDKYAHVASPAEIKENDYNLNIPRYVDTFEPEPEIDLDQVKADLKQLDEEISQNEQAFNELASQLVTSQVNDQSKPEAHNER